MRHTRLHTARMFPDVAWGKYVASEIPTIFDVFGPQINTFMSNGILLKYFRRRLLQFERSKTVSNLGVPPQSLTKFCSGASFTRTSHYYTLNFT